MPTVIIIISGAVFTASSKFFSKIFIELQNEKKEKFVSNYLFNRKFTVLKTGLKMLCHVALICTIYCIFGMICAVTCQELKW